MTKIKILEYDELDSTNNEAKRLVRTARDSEMVDGASSLYGTVVTAKMQTAGRGRMGKSFYSPGGDSIYASFILPPPADFADQRITLLAGEAVSEALEKTTRYKPEIKGVNDIIVDGLKVCGILTEAIPGAVIVGIGININIDENDFPDELKGVAGSLGLSTGEKAKLFDALTEAVFRIVGAGCGQESLAL